MAKRKKGERPGFVAVEGPPAVGKAALVGHLAARSRVRTVKLDPRENPFLSAALSIEAVAGASASPDEATAGRAFSAQMFCLLARHAQQDGLRQGELFERRALSVGTFARDRVFAEATLSSEELALYDRIHAVLAPRAVRPDLTVLLMDRPEILHARLRARLRPWERQVSVPWMERLVQGFGRMAERWQSGPLLRIELGGVELGEDEDALESVAQEVVKAAAELGSADRRIVRMGARP
ncbi:MAG: deoxynucleoside kinase [Myxococcota bacterium]